MSIKFLDHTALAAELYPPAGGPPLGKWVRLATTRVAPGEARTWKVTRAPLRTTGSNGSSDLSTMIWQPDIPPVVYPTGVASGMSGALGRVTWGRDQVTHQAVFDWKRGGSFCVHGDYVEVDASMLLRDALFLPSDASVKAAATVEPASVNNSNPWPPTLSVDAGLINPGASVIVPIPDYAVAFRWCQYSGNSATLTCTQSDDLAILTPRFVTALNSQPSTWPNAQGAIPILATARYIRASHTGVAAMAVWFEFTLDIG